MVNRLIQVTSLSQNGLRDWLIQRFTSIILGAYTIFLLIYSMSHSLDFYTWQALFSSIWFRLFSLITLVSLMLHAWIGLWVVTTDYLKCPALRLSVQFIIGLALLVFFFWGVEILWGFI